MKLIYVGRSGSCRYYWRVFSNGSKVYYYKVDGGNGLCPVAT